MSSYEYDGVPLSEYPLQTKYLYSVYFVMTTMSSVGYGDVLPKNPNGMIHPLAPARHDEP